MSTITLTETCSSTSESERSMLRRLAPSAKLPVNRVPSYFWGQDVVDAGQGFRFRFPVETGYIQERKLIGDGSPEAFERLVGTACEIVASAFRDLDDDSKDGSNEKKRVVELELSAELQQWREDQFRMGRKLPSKGTGLTRTSDEVIRLLRVEDWPQPLLMNGALFGSGMANMLIGAYDAETLYSNYCVDMGFFYEHGYHRVFPEFEPLLKQAFNDSHALQTLGGRERRTVAEIGLRYIREKVSLEEVHKAKLANKTARLNRHEMLTLYPFESSILGMAGEAIALGQDRGAVVNDWIFSSPGTDIVDVGSDLVNSELFNAFLNVTDLTESGVITEDGLRRVYDAWAHSCGRLFTERWAEPGARLCATLYSWHIQNDRHYFLRRALLGYPKARKNYSGQREAEYCEVFDPEFRTTGFSRPLKQACNGADICDQVEQHLRSWSDDGLLAELWRLLAVAPMQYVTKGVVCPEEEAAHAERSRVTMCQAYSQGLADEVVWLLAHASQHAWQVNYLFEAAMFGSLLDNEGLRGKLDRYDPGSVESHTVQG